MVPNGAQPASEHRDACWPRGVGRRPAAGAACRAEPCCVERGALFGAESGVCLHARTQHVERLRQGMAWGWGALGCGARCGPRPAYLIPVLDGSGQAPPPSCCACTLCDAPGRARRCCPRTCTHALIRAPDRAPDSAAATAGGFLCCCGGGCLCSCCCCCCFCCPSSASGSAPLPRRRRWWAAACGGACGASTVPIANPH